MIEADINDNVFVKRPLLIARMDQLARNEDLHDQLDRSDWDLVIVDETHRMGARYYNGKLTKRPGAFNSVRASARSLGTSY